MKGIKKAAGIVVVVGIGLAICWLLFAGMFLESQKVDEKDGGSSQSNSEKVAFPDFQGEDLEGNKISNEVFKKSKITVVNLWDTSCGPCIEELPDLQKISKAYEKEDVSVMGVLCSKKSAADALNIARKNKLTFPSLIAPDGFIEKFSPPINEIPQTFFVDQKGYVIRKVVGKNSYIDVKRMVDKMLEKIGGQEKKDNK